MPEGLLSRFALPGPVVVPNLLFPAADPDAPLVPLDEPDGPVSELCEEAPELLVDRREEPVELSEPLVPDMPDDETEPAPSSRAVSESTLPVTFRFFDC